MWLQWLRNLLALVLGFVAGSAVNMALVLLAPVLIAPPAGVDTSTAEGLRQGIHLFEPQHFLMPFLAHAVGTFTGALVAYLLAASHKKGFALAVGALFFCGGVAASTLIPAPVWFIAADLVLAYLPAAWLGILTGQKLNAPPTAHPRP